MNEENQSSRYATGKTGTKDQGQSLWHRLRSRLGHTCNDLVASNQVFQHLGLENTRDLGLQTVPLARIVGSSGRHKEFDLAFRPRRGRSERWLHVAQANGNELPPVSLYKVGDAYLIEDGNHRVSVAWAHGREFIEANVVEIDASRLQPEPSCQRLGYRV